jgi:hypothetical protein
MLSLLVPPPTHTHPHTHTHHTCICGTPTPFTHCSAWQATSAAPRLTGAQLAVCKNAHADPLWTDVQPVTGQLQDTLGACAWVWLLSLWRHVCLSPGRCTTTEGRFATRTHLVTRAAPANLPHSCHRSLVHHQHLAGGGIVRSTSCCPSPSTVLLSWSLLMHRWRVLPNTFVTIPSCRLATSHEA